MQSVYFCRIRIADTELWIRGRTISTWTNTVSGYTLRRREPQGRLSLLYAVILSTLNGRMETFKKYGLQSIGIEWLEFIASCNLLQKPLKSLFFPPSKLWVKKYTSYNTMTKSRYEFTRRVQSLPSESKASSAIEPSFQEEPVWKRAFLGLFNNQKPDFLLLPNIQPTTVAD